MKIKRALISVSDKTDLDEFTKELNKLGIEIISTGGTSRAIAAAGIPVTEVADYTAFPEMLDGRVKTLHPKVHAAILALRDSKEHMRTLKENGIPTIDMVVVNLYPFEKTIAKKNVSFEEAIENIDIGGPAMLRSAAKNFRSVAVISSPDQYEQVIAEMKSSGGKLSEVTRAKLAEKTFELTSKYDGAIRSYLEDAAKKEGTDGFLPAVVKKEFIKISELRYGENPHQKAAFYRDSDETGGITGALKLQGKELSFNNIMDLNAALELAREFERPAVAILKHNNPCGVAESDTLKDAYIEALDSDRLSAFGSVMVFNRAIDKKTAEIILEEADFIECILAPDYKKEALEVFSVKKNLRIMSLSNFESKGRSGMDLKKIQGGALIQEKDSKGITAADIKVVTKKSPAKDLIDQMLFGLKVVKHVKSNAIVLCRGTKTVGIGAGQMSRVDSVIIAINKAGKRAKGAIMASDAFFPKADSIEEAHKAGISAIIQPGGSIRDEEVIKACNKYDIPMVFTGVRHFRH
ncbi:MAG: bifunctional phosphoribosylaminoimidazolecarboxamide formyltransferase/IMP cyclohydrolase [Candidatus Omnitrophica bacterium]|nr:bifunctional phosphoribosylaminoimidazolecarboxamide formyltransferase/IMP cyclohydrolase [Candidatus Omnitrophota bacterium]